VVPKCSPALNPLRFLLHPSIPTVTLVSCALRVSPVRPQVSALLAGGADAKAVNCYGESALHLASRYGHEQVVRRRLALFLGVTHRA